MRTIDTDPERAEDVLVELAGHLPVDVMIGRPLIVTGRSSRPMLEKEPRRVEACEMVFTDLLAMWFLEDDAAVRFVELAEGRRELTRWSHGVEVSRQVTAL
jgi:hypothetical protein